MRIILIGRTKVLLDTAQLLERHGHKIVGVITSKSAPEYKVTEKEFKSFSDIKKIPFIHDAKINYKKISEKFSKVDADIGISINYNGIIPTEVISFFKHGILNAHGGDLPKYRGNACQAWAIINGEKKVGLCIHKMIGDDLDSGDIIRKEYIPIQDETTIGDVYNYFNQLIPNMFVESVNLLGNNPDYILEEQSKDPNKHLRCYPRKPEDGKINWDDTSIKINRLIRASSEPYSGAFTYLDDLKIIIWRAKLIKSKADWLGIPGQVAEIYEDGGVAILTNQGKIKIEEIEANGKRMKPSALLNSIRKRLK